MSEKYFGSEKKIGPEKNFGFEKIFRFKNEFIACSDIIDFGGVLLVVLVTLVV